MPKGVSDRKHSTSSQKDQQSLKAEKIKFLQEQAEDRKKQGGWGSPSITIGQTKYPRLPKGLCRALKDMLREIKDKPNATFEEFKTSFYAKIWEYCRKNTKSRTRSPKTQAFYDKCCHYINELISENIRFLQDLALMFQSQGSKSITIDKNKYFKLSQSIGGMVEKTSTDVELLKQERSYVMDSLVDAVAVYKNTKRYKCGINRSWLTRYFYDNSREFLDHFDLIKEKFQLLKKIAQSLNGGGFYNRLAPSLIIGGVEYIRLAKGAYRLFKDYSYRTINNIDEKFEKFKEDLCTDAKKHSTAGIGRSSTTSRFYQDPEKFIEGLFAKSRSNRPRPNQNITRHLPISDMAAIISRVRDEYRTFTLKMLELRAGSRCQAQLLDDKGGNAVYKIHNRVFKCKKADNEDEPSEEQKGNSFKKQVERWNKYYNKVDPTLASAVIVGRENDIMSTPYIVDFDIALLRPPKPSRSVFSNTPALLSLSDKKTSSICSNLSASISSSDKKPPPQNIFNNLQVAYNAPPRSHYHYKVPRRTIPQPLFFSSNKYARLTSEQLLKKTEAGSAEIIHIGMNGLLEKATYIYRIGDREFKCWNDKYFESKVRKEFKHNKVDKNSKSKVDTTFLEQNSLTCQVRLWNDYYKKVDPILASATMVGLRKDILSTPQTKNDVMINAIKYPNLLCDFIQYFAEEHNMFMLCLGYPRQFVYKKDKRSDSNEREYSKVFYNPVFYNIKNGQFYPTNFGLCAKIDNERLPYTDEKLRKLKSILMAPSFYCDKHKDFVSYYQSMLGWAETRGYIKKTDIDNELSQLDNQRAHPLQNISFDDGQKIRRKSSFQEKKQRSKSLSNNRDGMQWPYSGSLSNTLMNLDDCNELDIESMNESDESDEKQLYPNMATNCRINKLNSNFYGKKLQHDETDSKVNATDAFIKMDEIAKARGDGNAYLMGSTFQNRGLHPIGTRLRDAMSIPVPSHRIHSNGCMPSQYQYITAVKQKSLQAAQKVQGHMPSGDAAEANGDKIFLEGCSESIRDSYDSLKKAIVELCRYIGSKGHIVSGKEITKEFETALQQYSTSDITVAIAALELALQKYSEQCSTSDITAVITALIDGVKREYRTLMPKTLVKQAELLHTGGNVVYEMHGRAFKCENPNYKDTRKNKQQEDNSLQEQVELWNDYYKEVDPTLASAAIVGHSHNIMSTPYIDTKSKVFKDVAGLSCKEQCECVKKVAEVGGLFVLDTYNVGNIFYHQLNKKYYMVDFGVAIGVNLDLTKVLCTYEDGRKVTVADRLEGLFKGVCYGAAHVCHNSFSLYKDMLQWAQEKNYITSTMRQEWQKGIQEQEDLGASQSKRERYSSASLLAPHNVKRSSKKT